MNKNLLKTFLVALGLAAGVSGNAAEITETYDFATAITGTDGDNLTLTSEAIAQEGDFNPSTVYVINDPTFGGETMSLNGRFAVNYDSNSKTKLRWMWRNGANEKLGLAGNWYNPGADVASFNLSILNLKNGDKLSVDWVGTKTDAKLKVVKSGTLKINGATLSAGDVVESGKTYIVVAEGTDPVHVDFAITNNNFGIHKITITTQAAEGFVPTPTGELTAVNGTSRTVTFDCQLDDAKLMISETKDGEFEEFNGVYKTSESKTVYVKAALNGVESEVLEYPIEAGTEVSLAQIITTTTAIEEGFNRTWTVSCDNKDVLLKPTATLSYVFTPVGGEAGEPVAIEDGGTITATAAGTYVVTATAVGYKSTTVTIDNTVAYELAKEISFISMKDEDFADTEMWTKSTDSDNKWGWSEDAPATYYSLNNLETNAATAIEGVELFTNTTPKFYIGYGLMANYFTTGGGLAPLKLTDAEEGQWAVYTISSKYGVSTVNTCQEATAVYSLYRYSDILQSIKIYAPAVSKTIPAESGYASFSADKAVTVPEDVTVYKAAVSAEGDAIVLTPVDTEVIPANTGVLLYSETAGDKVFYTATEAAAADFSGNELIATSVKANATVPTEGTYYALKAGVAEFAVINGGVELSANKAYIKAPENSDAKPMRMVIGGQTTGINEVDAADGAADGAYYTLQGVKVENPTKGLYIHNGKKVIIK